MNVYNKTFFKVSVKLMYLTLFKEKELKQIKLNETKLL